MSRVFLDTSGLIAVVNTDDQWHGPALTVDHHFQQAAFKPLITR